MEKITMTFKMDTSVHEIKEIICQVTGNLLTDDEVRGFSDEVNLSQWIESLGKAEVIQHKALMMLASVYQSELKKEEESKT